jgi:RND superfamily putative drug exporter
VIRLTRAALRRPRTTIVAWLLVVAALAVIGTQAQDRVKQTDLTLSDTPSAVGAELALEQFGPSLVIPVLLRGDRDELDRQGPRVVRALRRRPGAQVLSPWDRGANRELLRPGRNDALIVVRQAPRPGEGPDEIAPPVQRMVDRAVTAPLRAHVSGVPAILTALKDRSFDAVERAERIAAVALLLVLLAVFRTPLAALVPAAAGIVSVLSGYGIIALLATKFSLDTVAVSLASMMGLALGVDYSLLMVSRFREELGRREPVDAALTASRTAGHAVQFAALVLLVAMAVAALVAPGNLLLSAAMGVVIVTGVSMLAALTLVPVLLALMGHRIEWLRFGRKRPQRTSAVARLVQPMLRRPLPVALVVGATLLAMSAPALALKTGAPDVRQLPEDTRARKDFEVVKRVLGPGWTAPFEVITVARSGTIADDGRLERLGRFQDAIARDRDVALVVGPGDAAPAARQTRRLTKDFAKSADDADDAKRAVRRLDSGLERAQTGVAQLRGGLRDASNGAQRLARGGADGAEGAGQLRAGLLKATSGARRARRALRSAGSGARRLTQGARKLASGARRLEGGAATARKGVDASLPRLRELADGLAQGSRDLDRLAAEPATMADDELGRAYEALAAMSLGRTDPQYRRAYEAVARARAAVTGRNPLTGERVDPTYDGLPAALRTASGKLGEAATGAQSGVRDTERLAAGLRRLETGADQLAHGGGELADGVRSLGRGLDRLESGSGDLAAGLSRLSDGAAQLDSGLARLTDGAGRLASGLSSGVRDSGRLEAGVGRLERGSDRFESRVERAPVRRIRLVNRRSPNADKSGYLTLAGLDGARKADRTEAAFAINLDRGGRAGRMLVIPRTGANTETTELLGERLKARTAELARATATTAAVTGPAAQLSDYGKRTSEGLLTLIAALAVLSWFALIPVCRSLLLPLIAVALNLLTVAVAFGALSLLFQGSAPLLGGPGYVDAVSISVIYTVIFGLSIDYEVFLITRMREIFERTGDGDRAIVEGLDRTAGVVTGAAAIMVAVFVAFATADVVNVRQFGVGLSIAVLIDATIVRLVLLPAAMRLGGRWTWWLPDVLERRLPRLAA